MILDEEIKSQLDQYLQHMEGDILIQVSAGNDQVSKDMLSLLDEIASMSQHIRVESAELNRTPSFSVSSKGADSRIVFAGVPLGHEFTSLVLALLQASGRPPKIDEKTIARVKKITGTYHFETYVSLGCHNCPEVVQALNMMSILNPAISHTMIDGAAFKSEIEEKDILAVPAIYCNGEFFARGRMTLEEILSRLDESPQELDSGNQESYDVLVVGGGPAGAGAAIYAARKGIRTVVVAERFGGQVMDTLGIENLIGTKYTEGPKLAADLEEHMKEYPMDMIQGHRAKQLQKKEFLEVTLDNGMILQSRTVILATGARWKNVNVPGEQELRSKGVAYCPHCDGPLFQGKDVAVIGGGNSGIEAAIDLAGIVKHVTVLEFMPELKADAVLQKKLYSLSNITVLKNVQTKEITGTSKVDGITYADRATGEEIQIGLAGVFVQIGLTANTEWLLDTVEQNQIGEIVVDSHNATSIPGVFAAGDCTNSPYKQIVISIGSGANAALSAFDYLIRS